MAISNDSGAGGAALHKRNFGETIKVLNTSFPHWFRGNFQQYSDREESVPFDPHERIALIAPQPVLIESANADLWADPRDEFLAARAMPEFSHPILSTVGYNIRPGPHDVKAEDGEVFLAFAERHLHHP